MKFCTCLADYKEIDITSPSFNCLHLANEQLRVKSNPQPAPDKTRGWHDVTLNQNHMGHAFIFREHFNSCRAVTI